MRGSLLLSTAGVLITLMVVSVSVHLIVTMGELKWEAGREEGLVEGIGVFGLGGLLLALVSLFGLAGMVWGRRGPAPLYRSDARPDFGNLPEQQKGKQRDEGKARIIKRHEGGGVRRCEGAGQSKMRQHRQEAKCGENE